MGPERYLQLLTDLLSRDPERVRLANQEMYAAVVRGANEAVLASSNGRPAECGREADLALARAAA